MDFNLEEIVYKLIELIETKKLKELKNNFVNHLTFSPV